VQDRIYTLFNENMAPLSEGSSMGYTESGKREELFDHSGRMILLRRTSSSSEKVEEEGGVDMPGRLPDIKGKGRDMEGEVMGYVSFRFDTEETLGPRDAEVIYWYVLPTSSVMAPIYHFTSRLEI
jgi:hypothetical protein